MTAYSGDGTARAIATPEATHVQVDEPFAKPVLLSYPMLPMEDTMTSSEVELEAASPFGEAVRRMPGGRLLVDMAKVRRIYQLTAPDERKEKDRGTCGRLRSEFVPEQSDYTDDRYE